MLRIHRCEGDRLVAQLIDPTAVRPSDALTGPPGNGNGRSGSTSTIPRRKRTPTSSSALGISLPSREEMQEIEVSARLYNEGGAEFMTITALAMLDSDEPVHHADHVRAQGRQARDHAPFAEPRPSRPRRAGAEGRRRGLRDRRADHAEPDRGPHRPHGRRPGARRRRDRGVSRSVFRPKAKRGRHGKTRDLAGTIEQIGTQRRSA